MLTMEDTHKKKDKKFSLCVGGYARITGILAFWNWDWTTLAANGLSSSTLPLDLVEREPMFISYTFLLLSSVHPSYLHWAISMCNSLYTTKITYYLLCPVFFFFFRFLGVLQERRLKKKKKQLRSRGCKS